jgi:hypothetical protein
MDMDMRTRRYRLRQLPDRCPVFANLAARRQIGEREFVAKRDRSEQSDGGDLIATADAHRA